MMRHLNIFLLPLSVAQALYIPTPHDPTGLLSSLEPALPSSEYYLAPGLVPSAFKSTLFKRDVLSKGRDMIDFIQRLGASVTSQNKPVPTRIRNNWYNRQVSAINYHVQGANSNPSVRTTQVVPSPAKEDYYLRVTNMNAQTGQCDTARHTFSSANSILAPLDEEVSAHFRGPVSLERFAVFMPQSGLDSAWNRVSYYSRGERVASGVTFLNNLGGRPLSSGVFDMSFGNSLSYASADGQSSSPDAQILQGDLHSNQEVILMSDRPCVSVSENTTQTTCGYVRPGTVAYHGWNGPEKLFIAKFKMPNDSSKHGNGFNANMPAYWFLNAQIPRTVQYGHAGCSCWSSGCGEIDACEVLDAGSGWCKSSVHVSKRTGVAKADNAGGGTPPEYFVRPVDAPVTMAVLFKRDGLRVSVILDESTAFAGSMTREQFRQLVGDAAVDVSPSAVNGIADFELI